MANQNLNIEEMSLLELKGLVYDLDKQRIATIQNIQYVEQEINKRSMEEQKAIFQAQQEQAKKNGKKENKLEVAEDLAVGQPT